jgi:hypothetical protein
MAPRPIRSSMSSALSCGVAGTTTAPSFMQARMVSQMATSFGSMTMTRSPRRTPRPRSQLATWFERRDRAS